MLILHDRRMARNLDDLWPIVLSCRLQMCAFSGRRERLGLEMNTQKEFTMKRLVLTGLMILLVSSLVGMVQAQMYWDQSEVPDATIKDSDFDKGPANQRPAKSLGDRGIYDNYQVPDVEPEAERQNAPITPAAAAPEPRVITPPRQTDTTRSTTDLLRRPRATIRRSTERTANPRTTVSQPKPAETSPGEPSAVTRSPEPSVSGLGEKPATSVTPGRTTPPEETERPSTKRMKWGQGAEEKTSEPKPKLQWGR